MAFNSDDASGLRSSETKIFPSITPPASRAYITIIIIHHQVIHRKKKSKEKEKEEPQLRSIIELNEEFQSNPVPLQINKIDNQTNKWREGYYDDE
jgi:hypothetical protein